MQRAEVEPVQLLGGKGRDDIQVYLDAMFKQFDVNSDGRLDRTEFRTCLQSADLGLNRQQITALMGEFDEDQDGLISVEEFKGLAYRYMLHVAREKALKQLEYEKKTLLFVGAQTIGDKSYKVQVGFGRRSCFGLRLFMPSSHVISRHLFSLSHTHTHTHTQHTQHTNRSSSAEAKATG